MKRFNKTTCAVLAVLIATAAPLAAQHDGGGGGGGGCGDIFGDLFHVLRDGETGQPILERRYIELPKDVPGYGWGYCPIAVDLDGNEIGFLPYSCELAEPGAAIELDYFGRLSGGRTKEKNHRMHFDEVISTIKMAGRVKQEPATGRLMMGFDCEQGHGNSVVCAEWKVVDSPMESLSLYTRLMKYGHLQTDPDEVDVWWHGDPATTPPPTHPALGPADWAEFDSSVRHLLPGDGQMGCFADDGVFNTDCAETHSLSDRDFISAASWLSAAANKTGMITWDLTQFINRILKITIQTPHTMSNRDTLPALIRDCEDPSVDYLPPDENDPSPVDPGYLPVDDCYIYEAYPGLDNYGHFFEVQERFVDYSRTEYDRNEWREENFDELILPSEEEGIYEVAAEVPLIPYLAMVNGPEPSDPYYYPVTFGIEAFVEAACDGVRAIEFIHNYAVPDALMTTAGPEEVENKPRKQK